MTAACGGDAPAYASGRSAARTGMGGEDSMMNCRFAGGIVLLMVLGFPVSASAVELVRNGEPQTVIVVADRPVPVVAYAAEELQYHIERATGARLPIMNESDNPEGPRGCVYLGACRATTEAGVSTAGMAAAGFVIKTMGGDLLLAGDDSDGPVGSHHACTRHGTLWAVYQFLEQQMGVRWVWPGTSGEIIPAAKDLQVAELEQAGRPRFLQSMLIVPSLSRGEDLRGWASAAARDRFFEDQDKWLLRHRFATTTNLAYGHAFGNYWQRFGQSHPEFFNMLANGKREPLPWDATGAAITLSVSEPALWKQIVEDWAQSSAAPARPYLNACENDSAGLCTCPSCRAWDAPDPRFETSPYWGRGVIPDTPRRSYGLGVGIVGGAWPWSGIVVPEDAPSLSDRYARFYLALQQEAQKVDPQAVVFGYAYANYWHAPKQTSLNDHIVISYVPPLWFPYTEEMSASFRENWDGWRAAGVKLVLRPNLTHAGHNLPIFYARRLAADFSYAAGRGMIGTSFDSLQGAWAAQGPTLYVLARVHEHPDWPVERMLDEYYGAFGKAEPQVRRYFEHWEAVSNAVTLDDIRRYNVEEGMRGGGFLDYVMIADRIFTPPIMARGRDLMQSALEAAAGDPLAEQRVSYLEEGLRDAELTLETLAAHKAHQRAPSAGTERTYREAIARMVAQRARAESDDVCNMGYMAHTEKWDYSLSGQDEVREQTP
jgi:hypothetical protein